MHLATVTDLENQTPPMHSIAASTAHMYIGTSVPSADQEMIELCTRHRLIEELEILPSTGQIQDEGTSEEGNGEPADTVE